MATMNLNFDYMGDRFFKQTPAELKQVGEILGVNKDFFTYTFKKLTEYAVKAGIQIPSNNTRLVTTKKRTLIRKILIWQQMQVHQDILKSKMLAPKATCRKKTVQQNDDDDDDDDVQIIENPIERYLILDSEDEIENPLLLCVVCTMKQRSVVYNDCHHLVCCTSCSNRCGLTCPMCRKVNHTKQQIYIC